MEQTLKRQGNIAVAHVLIEVEYEFVTRALERYIRENNVDVTDIEALTQAQYEVMKVSRWLEHKRVNVVIPEERPIMLQEPEIDHAKRMKRLTAKEIEELRNKALALPVDMWGTLLTPTLKNRQKNIQESDRIYAIREDEKRVLNTLKKELEPAKLEKLEVVASSVNNARMK